MLGWYARRGISEAMPSTGATRQVEQLGVLDATERNLENLSNELRGVEELRRDHARAQTSLGKSIAGSVALLDSRDEAERFCQAIRARMQQPPASRLIDGCETISSVVPGDQEAKLSLLREV